MTQTPKLMAQHSYASFSRIGKLQVHGEMVFSTR